MNIYAGTFLIAFSTLALEVTLARLLSVITWYHLAFFAISTAMLGMTAGATRVYLRADRFGSERLCDEIGRACLHYAIVVPVSLIVLCLLPLDLQKTIMSPIVFLIATVACALPFYYSGIAVTAILTRGSLPIGKVYASDLIGASTGCLFVLGGLEIFDAPSLILLCSAVAILARLAFAAGGLPARRRRAELALFVAVVVLAFANSYTQYGIRPFVIKGRVQAIGRYLMERWNSYSRIVVYQGGKGSPMYWGPSPLAPADDIYRFAMNIDGEAGTHMRRFRTMADIEHLKFDVVNIGYFLGRGGNSCVIGVGGGRDIQSAILFGQKHVTGIDVNPIFIDLLRNEFKDFAGIAGRDDVTLVVDDARSYLTRTPAKYSIIQMSLIDTWASTGAGAFSLSENALYTIEAWRVFLSRLEDQGLFTVSRWYNPGNVSETGRLLGLAVAALLDQGAQEPSRHIALFTSQYISTLLISRQPFSEQDVALLRDTCEHLQYNPICLPGQPPKDDVLRAILSATSWDQLRAATTGKDLNYEPPTDETPYFFNMLRLGKMGSVLQTDSGVLRGNLVATLTLLVLLASLLVLTIVTIVVPLALRPRLGGNPVVPSAAFWSGAAYFSLIGCGFMLVEMALIQKLSVFLGHPVYALGILLFTLIASTGVGSFVSDRLPLTRRPWMFAYPLVAAAAVLAARFLLKWVLADLITCPTATKIGVAVLTVFPLGILMGFFFPAGMRLARLSSSDATPWYWALNGMFGVLCSALAVFLSIYVSISTNFYIAVACYAAVALCVAPMSRGGAPANENAGAAS